jgi:hypothetical protein
VLRRAARPLFLDVAVEGEGWRARFVDVRVACDGWHRVRAKRRRGAMGGREGAGDVDCGRRMSVVMAAEEQGDFSGRSHRARGGTRVIC